MEKMEKESLTAQSSPENPAENTPEKPELNERVGIAEAICYGQRNREARDVQRDEPDRAGAG